MRVPSTAIVAVANRQQTDAKRIRWRQMPTVTDRVRWAMTTSATVNNNINLICDNKCNKNNR